MNRGEAGIAAKMLEPYSQRVERIGDGEGGLALSVQWRDGNQTILYTLDQVRGRTRGMIRDDLILVRAEGGIVREARLFLGTHDEADDLAWARNKTLADGNGIHVDEVVERTGHGPSVWGVALRAKVGESINAVQWPD